MNAFLLEYLPIVIFLGIATVLCLGFMLAARMKFDVRFYLVSILFIIFDLEVAFLFPWAVSMFDLSRGGMVFAFWSMMVFLGVLTVGFIYEWKKGALEWE